MSGYLHFILTLCIVPVFAVERLLQELTGFARRIVKISAWLKWLQNRLMPAAEEIAATYIRQGMRVIVAGAVKKQYVRILTRAVESGGLLTVAVQGKNGKFRLEKTGALQTVRPSADASSTDPCTGTIGIPASSADSAVCISALRRNVDKADLFKELYDALHPAGTLLLLERSWRTGRRGFQNALSVAETTGFIARSGPKTRGWRIALLVRLC